MSREHFPITLSMRSFFSDYRCKAKIFINDKLNTISDLENKISEIFGIRNFHLVSDSQFLPSSEDIRILEKGDIISAVPSEPHSNLLLLSSYYYGESSRIPLNASQSEIVGSSKEKIKSKKKKSKLTEENNAVEIESNNEIPAVKRKKWKIKDSSDCIITSTPYDQDHDLNDVFIFNSDKKAANENLNTENLEFRDRHDKIRKKEVSKDVKKTNSRNCVENRSSGQLVTTDTECVADVEMEEESPKLNVAKLNNNVEKPKKNRDEGKIRRKSTSSDSSGSDDSSNFCKKKNKQPKVSWNNSLLKSTNHVPIKKVVITDTEIDLSRFQFRECDRGVVPTPNDKEKKSLDIQIKIEHTLGETNIEKCKEDFQMETEALPENNSKTYFSSMNEQTNSSISGCEKINTISKSDNIQTTNECISLNFEVTDNSSSILHSYNLKNSNEPLNDKNELREKIFRKIHAGSSQSDESSTKAVVSDTSSVTSKILNMNSNSTKIKRKHTSGLAYYMQLLKKIDWDMTKSISSVNIDDQEVKESDNDKKNNENVIAINNENKTEKDIIIDDEILEDLESINKSAESVPPSVISSSAIEDIMSNSSLDTNFVTKRKRKRKHKKKLRNVMLLPEKTWDNVNPVPKVAAPKIHIRFENNGTDGTEREELLDTKVKVNESNGNEEKIKIIQDVALKLADSISEQESSRQDLKCDSLEGSLLNSLVDFDQSDVDNNKFLLEQAKMRVLKFLESSPMPETSIESDIIC